jgi:2'-5' RNA ligase
MHGIVSLLDNKHYHLVEELWAELEREFAVRGVYITPYPHFSYQIAQGYNVELLEPILQTFASGQATFQVKTSGLGIFNGPHPVLYVPVVRSPELTQFHQALWPEISTAGSGISDYYHPANWMPHITIGFGDINKENLFRIVQSLVERDFSWEITVDNIALIYDTGTKQELRSRFAFGKS